MISAFKKILSKLNRARKNKFKFSYVRREKFNETAEKYELLIHEIVSIQNAYELQPAIRCVQPVSIQSGAKDVCIFVSYSAELKIKNYVVHHIKALISQGIAVVLVINTDADFSGCDDLRLSELSGLYVRGNKGFDFGAWSHIYKLIELDACVERLYLINDSMIGPLTDRMLDGVVKKIQKSSVDLIGLTANPEPVFHLQSFFLVISKRLLNDERFSQFFKSLWNLPTKDMVIDFYEKRLTTLVKKLGFQVEVLFDTRHLENNKSDPVIHSVDDLLKMDFPYVKTSMARKPQGLAILNQFPTCVSNHSGG